jgi:hypothetical protein
MQIVRLETHFWKKQHTAHGIVDEDLALPIFNSGVFEGSWLPKQVNVNIQVVAS